MTTLLTQNRIRLALAGNPNCGKTTLFNLLTQSTEYVGNRAGVTIEKKHGVCKFAACEVIDLPGTYSLSPYSPEEQVTRNDLIDEKHDVIVNIIDGTNLERNFYLTLQILELQRPTVIAINMVDQVRRRGQQIDYDKLSNLLGVPVIPICAKNGENIEPLLSACKKSATQNIKPHTIQYCGATLEAINRIMILLNDIGLSNDAPYLFYATKLLEGDHALERRLRLSTDRCQEIETIAKEFEKTVLFGDRETLLADSRYQAINRLVRESVTTITQPRAHTITDKIDAIVTHRVFALPLFLLIFCCIFALTFGSTGQYVRACIDRLCNEWLSSVIRTLLTSLDAPKWCYGLLIDAVLSGVGSVLAFLPQITILFTCLSILEDSGYMARVAFIMDRLLRTMGLSGKSFIPMLMGFGCTTPAVMATRTLENKKDRIMTILLTPFLPCSAKLGIYVLFAETFFERYQVLVIVSLYLLSIIVSLLSGRLLRCTALKSELTPFVMELPAYHLPSAQTILRHVWEKLKGFLIKAGTVIFAMSVMLWLLQNLSCTLTFVSNTSQSILATLGKLIAPLFIPLGFGQWQSVVALMSGLIAKESVVSTLHVLYGTSISAIKSAFTPQAAYAFMVFTLLYPPCISALTTIRHEMPNAKWTVFCIVFQFITAYTVSLLAYHICYFIF